MISDVPFRPGQIVSMEAFCCLERSYCVLPSQALLALQAETTNDLYAGPWSVTTAAHIVTSTTTTITSSPLYTATVKPAQRTNRQFRFVASRGDVLHYLCREILGPALILFCDRDRCSLLLSTGENVEVCSCILDPFVTGHSDRVIFANWWDAFQLL